MTDEELATWRERLAALRQSLDDAVLAQTGRSIGDLASERVLTAIMPEIEALYSDLSAENAALREQYECVVCHAMADYVIIGHAPGCSAVAEGMRIQQELSEP